MAASALGQALYLLCKIHMYTGWLEKHKILSLLRIPAAEPDEKKEKKKKAKKDMDSLFAALEEDGAAPAEVREQAMTQSG